MNLKLVNNSVTGTVGCGASGAICNCSVSHKILLGTGLLKTISRRLADSVLPAYSVIVLKLCPGSALRFMHARTSGVGGNTVIVSSYNMGHIIYRPL